MHEYVVCGRARFRQAVVTKRSAGIDSVIPLLMPHPIVEIDELARLVIDCLVEISPQTAVSFALACRSLEEPTLSSLWKRQESLDRLLMVLPGCTRVVNKYGIKSVVSGRDFPVYGI